MYAVRPPSASVPRRCPFPGLQRAPHLRVPGALHRRRPRTLVGLGAAFDAFLRPHVHFGRKVHVGHLLRLPRLHGFVLVELVDGRLMMRLSGTQIGYVGWAAVRTGAGLRTQRAGGNLATRGGGAGMKAQSPTTPQQAPCPATNRAWQEERVFKGRGQGLNWVRTGPHAGGRVAGRGGPPCGTPRLNRLLVLPRPNGPQTAAMDPTEALAGGRRCRACVCVCVGARAGVVPLPQARRVTRSHRPWPSDRGVRGPFVAVACV